MDTLIGLEKDMNISNRESLLRSTVEKETNPAVMAASPLHDIVNSTYKLTTLFDGVLRSLSFIDEKLFEMICDKENEKFWEMIKEEFLLFVLETIHDELKKIDSVHSYSFHTSFLI